MWVLDRSAAVYAIAATATLACATLLTCGYIAYMDLSGRWAGFKLHAKSSNTLRTYLQHLPTVFLGWLVIFLPFSYAYAHYYGRWLFAPIGSARWWVGLLDFVIAWYLNRFYGFFVHYRSHKHKWLFRILHGRHHLRLADLCAPANGQNTLYEFFFIDVLTYFGVGQLLLPVPWLPQIALCIWIGVMGAIDHCGFYVPGTIFDGRFHYAHHVHGRHNIGEFAFLDRWFGTYKRL